MSPFHGDLGTLLDFPSLAICISEGDTLGGRLAYVNHAFERLTGYAREELLGGRCPLLDSEGLEETHRQALMSALRNGHPFTLTLTCRRGDGEPFRNELSLSRLRLTDGRRYLIGIHRDVSQREAYQRRLELAQAVFNNTHDGILVTDAEKRIIDTNPAFTELTGYQRDEALGKKPNLLSSGKHDSGFYESMFAAVESRGYWSGDIWNTRKDGSQLIENTTISAIRDESGHIANYIGVFRDITQRRLNQARLERMASYDPLTGLFNREHFNTLLESQLASLEYTQSGLAVLFLDLDDFKPINDSYGHACGDELLIEISRRLKHLMRANDLTARFGGDEFVIALTGLGTADKAAKVAGKVMDDIIRPYQLDNGELVKVSVSIGIAFTSSHEVSAAQLLDAADAAMYEAKQQGKNRLAFATDLERQTESQDAYTLVKAAFEGGQIELFFQPILSIHRRSIIGFEALARWRHPEKGILGPQHFIDVITQSSLSLPYGRWLIDEAARVAKRFHAEGHAISIGVNLSQDQIETGAIVESLASARHHHGLTHPFLVAEVLESTHFHDLDLACGLLQEARNLGAQIALDDFGSGISSITYVSQLPLNTLKVDRTVTRHVEAREDRRQFVSGIIRMGHAMGLQVLAEGIESEEQLETLRLLGCDLAQGFHIGHPMAESEIIERYLAPTRPPRFALEAEIGSPSWV
ncbi:putative bifunctional diguanylate cyclase/phosphodiesterase [Halomonas salifodinae]|uniref:Bifunctional diguanylate cyclase/phosphodiesterase n=1 Tax=Halomonas salifodinae TaxID=438745 RepID=A0ABW2F3V3_9GAMM